jgi:tellurite resistance protein TehA-like permease
VVGTAAAACGLCLIFYALWTAGRRVQRSHYRRETWSYRDALVITGCMLILSIYLLPLPWVDKSSLTYNPYPILTLPQFDLLLALTSFLLIIPGLIKTKPGNDPFH